jgi:hypothetical protein
MQDLSHLAKGSLIMNSSMHAGNTVSVNPPFSPVGTESEATQGIETHSEPDIDIGPNNDDQLNVKMNDAGSVKAADYSWKKCP